MRKQLSIFYPVFRMGRHLAKGRLHMSTLEQLGGRPQKLRRAGARGATLGR